MAKIKYDVSGVDPEESKNVGNFEDPKPGLYRAKVKEINPGFSKGADGKPDRSKPRVEVIFSILDARYKGAQLWGYLTYGEGFPARKYDQFLLAFGISTKKRKGEWDSDKVVNKTCLVRVKAGTRQDGSYRAEVGAVLEDDGRVIDGDASDAAGSDEEWEGGDEELIEDGDESMEDEEYDVDARREELMALTAPEIKPIAKELGIGVSGKKKAEVVEAIIEAETADPEEEEGELEDDDEELLDDDEGTYLTEDQLKAMEVAELKETAGQFDIEIKGKKKSQVIAEILEAQAAPEDGDGDDELPF